MEPAAKEPVSATYHVFINHRGPDVKKNLASLIYHRLTNCHGLRVFLDKKEFHAGDALSPAILGAIQSASLHIAIFSESYAGSRWCLDELCWILDCNRKIVPVFWDVEPADLRHIDRDKGSYKEAFKNHQLEGRVAKEDIEKWKTALNKASEISGLMFKTDESDLGEVLEEIVKAVLKGVKWEPFEVAKYLVGLDPAVKEINDEIKKQRQVNGTAIVGIAGMAGVGKVLDLGCFFPGEDKEVAVRVLEGLGYKDVYDCLENLRQKCLIEYHDEVQSDDEIECPPKKFIKMDGFLDSYLSRKIVSHDSNDNFDYVYLPKSDKIAMHDHIRHLARHIAREEYGVLPPRKSLRLSCSSDIEELMLKMQGGADSCLIRGIRTEGLPDCTNYIKGVGVRLMVVEVPIDLSSFFGLWPMSGDLVWLRLRSFSSINFPHTISLGNLRVLELEGHGDLEELFQRFNMPPRNLSVLNIDVKGTQPRAILNHLGHPMQWRARRVLRVPTSDAVDVGTSDAAAALEWEDCLDLNDSEIFSDSAKEGFTASYFFRFLQWIGTSIKIPSKIVLKNIIFLQSLPIGFGELKSLTHLDLSSCIHLTELPNSFSELMHLQYLVLRDCIELALPIDILGNMSSLEYVDFRGCYKLKYLPTGIENQRCLRYLNLLYTEIKWPLNLELPEKLQRLRLGNLWERLLLPHHNHLGDLRRLKELKELILIKFNGARGILWEEIAGPNMKVLVIRDCPISIFSFKEQGTMQVGSVLRDLTLSYTEITEICIPEGVLPSLETLDLSGNRRLVQVKGLPSTLVRLNLQGCYKLKALINLSNLVDLKFLFINDCGQLETLNVEGLMSLEEIQAEECRELKSIEGLSQRERLKYLRISANTDVMWNDICNVLTSPSHQKLSTAFFSGKSKITYGDTKLVMPEMQSIREQFNLKVVDVVFPATPDGRFEFHTKMEDLQSYGGILMCFLTGCAEPGEFRVRFEASDDGRSAHEYIISGYDFRGGEPKVHVFMWTEECNLFRDDKCYNNIAVSYGTRMVDVRKGWIMMVDKNIDVSEVCKQFIIALS